MDRMTEISMMTDESEIRPQENVLDLRILNANIDINNLVALTGGV